MSTRPLRTIGEQPTQNGPTAFTVQKKSIPAMLTAITGGQLNQFSPPVKGLGDCEVSGKFARKIGQNRRALSAAMARIQVEREAIESTHTGSEEATHAALVTLYEGLITFECHGFTVEDFEGLKGVAPRVVDLLMDIEVGGPTNYEEAPQDVDARQEQALRGAGFTSVRDDDITGE